MTDNTEPITILTTRDHAILEQMLDRCRDRQDPLGRVLARKLANARVVRRDIVGANVVTISSRVCYRIDDGPVETRVLVHEEGRGMVGLTLPLSHPRGMAMLGLHSGASARIPLADGRVETLTVVQIPYQPEAAQYAKHAVRTGAGLSVNGTGIKTIRPDNDWSGNCDGPGPSVA